MLRDLLPSGNVARVYLLRIVSGLALGLWYPIVASYFKFFGMTQADMASLGQVFAVAFVVLEIPSGILADKMGRRPTLVLSGVLLVATFVVLSVTGMTRPDFSTTKRLLIAMEILLSFCVTLITGTDQALLWESLPAESRIAACAKHYSLIRMGESCATGIGALTGGFLFGIAPYLPTTISVALAIAFPIIAFTIVEPRHVIEKQSQTKNTSRSATWALIVFLGVWYSFSPSFRTFCQLVLSGNGYSNVHIGYAFGFGYIIAGCMAGFATTWVHRHVGEFFSLVITATVVVICYAGLATGTGWVTISLVMLYLFSDVFGSVVLVTYIASETAAAHRATLLSCAGVISRLSSLILLELYKSPSQAAQPLDALRHTFFQVAVIAATLLFALIGVRQFLKQPRVSA